MTVELIDNIQAVREEIPSDSIKINNGRFAVAFDINGFSKNIGLDQSQSEKLRGTLLQLQKHVDEYKKQGKSFGSIEPHDTIFSTSGMYILLEHFEINLESKDLKPFIKSYDPEESSEKIPEKFHVKLINFFRRSFSGAFR